MERRDVSIEALVSKIKHGEIKLPEMQRSYVWTDTRVRDLLDSLYRDYPSGAILIWDAKGEGATRDFSISQEKTESFQLLLDGQQRLTSLSAILLGKDIRAKKGTRSIDILFNLKHPEYMQTSTEDGGVHNEDENPEVADARKRDDPEKMTFVVKTNKIQEKPHWVSVTEVLRNSNDAKILKDCGIKGWDDPRGQKYADRLDKLRKIKDYQYDVHVLERDKSYEEVTEIFVRVNSLGATLRSSDLALAQITAKWPGSLEILEEFQKECKEKDFDVELGIFIRNLVIFATEQPKFNIVSNLSQKCLEDGWKHSKAGFEYALNFLESNIGINSPALLSTPYLIITLGYFASQNDFKLSPKMEKELRYWALIANAKGRYSSGSIETVLSQDITSIGKKEALPAMIRSLRKQFTRLDVLPEDLEGLNSQSAYFKTMFLIFKEDGAKDWHDGLVISLDHSGGSHKLQSHHIFPQACLKERGDVDKKKINDIANLCFIGGKTNRKIGKKPPSQYLPEIVEKHGKDVLEKQCIPTKKDLWEPENYDAFLQERRRLIVNRMNEFIGKSPLEKE